MGIIKSYIFVLLFAIPSVAFGMERAEKQSWDGKKYSAHSKAQYWSGLQALGWLDFNKYSTGKHIADIGCGSGKLTSEIASRVKSSTVIGMDLSESMIKEAQATYKGYSNLSFELQDGQNLPHKFENTFDLIVCLHALHWMPDKQRVYQGISKCLKPNGTVLIQCAQAIGKEVPFIFKIFHAAFSKYIQSHAISTDDVLGDHGINPATLQQDLQEAGLELREKKSDISFLVTFKNREAFSQWLATVAGGYPMLAQLPDDMKNKILQEGISAYLKECPANADGTIPYTGPAGIIFTAKKFTTPNNLDADSLQESNILPKKLPCSMLW